VGRPRLSPLRRGRSIPLRPGDRPDHLLPLESLVVARFSRLTGRPFSILRPAPGIWGGYLKRFWAGVTTYRTSIFFLLQGVAIPRGVGVRRLSGPLYPPPEHHEGAVEGVAGDSAHRTTIPKPSAPTTPWFSRRREALSCWRPLGVPPETNAGRQGQSTRNTLSTVLRRKHELVITVLREPHHLAPKPTDRRPYMPRVPALIHPHLPQ
jgi:hypothetical protein